MTSTKSGLQRLRGRVAIVTGASSGIGRATALAYASEGAKVICADRNNQSPAPAEADRSTADLVNDEGGEAIFHHTDVCSSSSVNALVAKAVSEYGRLDIVVNSAGVAPEIHNPQPIWSLPDTTWEITMGVNATGLLNMCRAATAQMMRQAPLSSGSRGWVVNISSIYGQTAAPGNVAYCSSKHAVLGLTKAAALDCAPHNIYVNAICPGFTATALTSSLLSSGSNHEDHIKAVQPLKGIGKPVDVARIAVVLGSDDASWMTGTAVAVDGGFLSQ